MNDLNWNDSRTDEQKWQDFLVSNTERIPQLRRYSFPLKQLRKHGKPVPPDLMEKLASAFDKGERIDARATDAKDKRARVARIRYGYGDLFEMGPDRGREEGKPGRGDLREQRPYFMVPLDKNPDVQAKVQARICDYLKQRVRQDVARMLSLEDVYEGGWDSLIETLGTALWNETNQPGTPPVNQGPGATVAQRVVTHFTEETRQSLQEAQTPGRSPIAPSEDLKTKLLGELNEALKSSLLYKERASKAGEKIEKEYEGNERIAANREVLEKAFPDTFKSGAELGPVTDIYVLSHGWHRNFFGAAAAYDRIAARIALLMHRERFTPIRRDPPFHPLFLMVHWHSDPGANGWVDRAGRRSKPAFLENCERLFERPTAHEERAVDPKLRFTSVMEAIYALFTRLSAPDTQALEDEELAEESQKLAEALNRFSLRDAPAAEQPDKVASVWAAYHAAPALRFLANQGAKPGRFVNSLQAILDLLGFFGKAVGVTTLGTLLLPRLQNHPWVKLLLDVVGQWWAWTTKGVGKILDPVAELFRSAGDSIHPPDWVTSVFAFLGNTVVVSITAYICLAALALLAVIGLSAATFVPTSERRKDGVNLSRLVAFVVLLVPCALPLIGFLLLTYIGGSLWPRLRYWFRKVLGDQNRTNKLILTTLFDERIGKRNETISVGDVSKLIYSEQREDGEIYRTVKSNWLKFPRYHLARLARWPVRLVRTGLAPENPGHPVIDLIDQQFAFWEMQVMGAGAGRRGALFVSGLYMKLDGMGLLSSDVRIHLLGHSFGGLLLGNLARHLRLDEECQRSKDEPIVPHLDSICLLEAAMASTWFEQEDKVREYIKGGIGCIFSGYDSANGFYYPLANNSRLAAGFVGLYQGYPEKKLNLYDIPLVLPPRKDLGRQGMFAALVLPPNLHLALEETITNYSPEVPRTFDNLMVNLDASRLIFDGPVPQGGGHSDIYKDDVMHLCWAVTRISHDKQKWEEELP